MFSYIVFIRHFHSSKIVLDDFVSEKYLGVSTFPQQLLFLLEITLMNYLIEDLEEINSIEVRYAIQRQ